VLFRSESGGTHQAYFQKKQAVERFSKQLEFLILFMKNLGEKNILLLIPV